MPSFDSKRDAQAWLDAHIDFESTVPSRRALPTLARMHELAALLGNPERAFPSIHLTGTNGKGSTAAMVTTLLGARGLVAGTYTSPNLAEVNERIARAGEPVDDETLTELIHSLALAEPAMSDRPTRFELLTAAALAWFADVAVDIAVMEVGVGGTWDATNIVDASVAVLTNVSYDHTDILGPTLDGIARDKAGIVKPGSTVVIGERNPELVEVIRAVADDAGAAAVWVRGEEYDCTENRLAVGGRLVDIRTPGGHYPDVRVPMHGAHQGVNAATALAAAEAFFGAPLDPDVVTEGFAAVRVPGRLEVLGRAPLVLVDGAHNVAGMEVLAASLADFSVAGPAVAVVGMLRGRDPLAMLAPLAAAGVGTVVACAPDTARAQEARAVADAAEALGMRVLLAPSVADGLAAATGAAGEEGLVVVTGSLYVVAEARGVLVGAHAGSSPPAG